MAEATGVYVAPEIEHSDWDATEERLELFTITRPDPEAADGVSRKTYDMPNKPNPGLGLAFLRMARLYGVELAVSWLLEEAVGTEGYLALANEPGTTTEQIATITSKVRSVVLGGLPKAP